MQAYRHMTGEELAKTLEETSLFFLNPKQVYTGLLDASEHIFQQAIFSLNITWVVVLDKTDASLAGSLCYNLLGIFGFL